MEKKFVKAINHSLMEIYLTEAGIINFMEKRSELIKELEERRVTSRSPLRVGDYFNDKGEYTGEILEQGHFYTNDDLARNGSYIYAGGFVI